MGSLTFTTVIESQKTSHSCITLQFFGSLVLMLFL